MQNRGLLSAPAGSPVLPVLLANRSATLFKMNRFADCVSDIDEALRLGYPDNLHYKVSKQGDRWKDGNGRKRRVKCSNVILYRYWNERQRPYKSWERIARMRLTS